MAGQQGDEPGPEKAEATPAAGAVDIRSLADRVYRLMLRDARLAQARSADRRRKE